jgi:hypothetical protein
MRSTRLYAILFTENFLALSSHNSLSLLAAHLEAIGASKTYIAAFANANSVGLLAIVLLGGSRLASIDRGKALRASFALLTASMLGMWLFHEDLALLFLMRLAGSASFGCAFLFNMSMVYEASSGSTSTSAIALFGVSGLSSNLAGAIGGEAVLSTAGPRGIFVMGAGFALAAFIAAVLIGSAGKPMKGEMGISVPSILKSRRDMRGVFVMAYCFGLAFVTLSSFIPLLTLERYGRSFLSAYFIPFVASSIIIRFLGKALFDKVPKEALALAGFCLMAISFASLLAPGPEIIVWCVGAVYGVGHSLLFPVLSGIFVERGGLAQRASYNNAFVSLNTLGGMTLAPLVGMAGDLLGLWAVFALSLCVATLCVFVAAAERVRRPRM